jgi:hypothetical protein
MKVTGFMGVALALTFALFVFGCASSGSAVSSDGTVDSDLVAGEGETLVIVERESSFVGSAIKYEVYIDGNKVLTLSNGATGKVVVPHGEHTIYTRVMRPIGEKPVSEQLSFTAASIDLYFRTRPNMNNVVLEADY